MGDSRWMMLCTCPGDQPPRQLPPGAVWIKLSGGNPAAPAADPGPASADELNAWPDSKTTATRRGNAHERID